MSKESSPAEQSKLVLASDTDETVTPVSHVFGISDLTTSLEAMNPEAEKKQPLCTAHKLALHRKPTGAQDLQTRGTREGPHLHG